MEYINRGIPTDGPQLSRRAQPLVADAAFALTAAERTYDKQYYSMYQCRLAALKPRVERSAIAKWGDGTKKIDGSTVVRRDKILDIALGQICWVTGTVFCDLGNKLDVLHDVEKGTDDTLPSVPPSYVSDAKLSIVMLEDESGRAILHNDDFLDRHVMVTGCIVAVLGVEIQPGVFEIMDVAYPQMAPQPPLAPPAAAGARGKIAFVSGLNMSSAEERLEVELLKQWLCGEVGGGADAQRSSQVERLVIAGDSIKPRPHDDAAVSTSNFGSKNTSSLSVTNIEQFDAFVHELLPSLPVTVMPGAHDPAEICLPQQPIHRALLHQNKNYIGGSLSTVTNPVWLHDEGTGLQILGTLGQNVDDIKRYRRAGDDARRETELLDCCIRWQNIAPTAPDTLYCYPFSDRDPFTLAERTPHVLFAGNQPQFGYATTDHDGVTVRLLSIPAFARTRELVLLDVGALTCEVVRFST